jgi:hypothetical protein
MNFLPPRPWTERFFHVWLALIILGLLAGIFGLTFAERKLEAELRPLRKTVEEKRKELSRAIDRKNAEQRFQQEHHPEIRYRDVVNQLQASRISWQAPITWAFDALPADARLFRLAGVGNRLEGWGLFPSIQKASEYLTGLTVNHSEIEEAWVDCIGDSCATLPDSLAQVKGNQVVVRFHFTIKRMTESKGQKGGERPFDPSSNGSGNPPKR